MSQKNVTSSIISIYIAGTRQNELLLPTPCSGDSMQKTRHGTTVKNLSALGSRYVVIELGHFAPGPTVIRVIPHCSQLRMQFLASEDSLKTKGVFVESTSKCHTHHFWTAGGGKGHPKV